MAHAGTLPPTEPTHPRPAQYAAVAVALLVITVAELTLFYLPRLRPILVPALLTLSAAKFALVALFYMHLKADARVFSWLFVTPLAIAGLVVLALLKLFGVL